MLHQLPTLTLHDSPDRHGPQQQRATLAPTANFAFASKSVAADGKWKVSIHADPRRRADTVSGLSADELVLTSPLGAVELVPTSPLPPKDSFAYRSSIINIFPMPPKHQIFSADSSVPAKNVLTVFELT